MELEEQKTSTGSIPIGTGGRTVTTDQFRIEILEMKLELLTGRVRELESQRLTPIQPYEPTYPIIIPDGPGSWSPMPTEDPRFPNFPKEPPLVCKNECSVCKLDFGNGPMGYVCTRTDCPSFPTIT